MTLVPPEKWALWPFHFLRRGEERTVGFFVSNAHTHGWQMLGLPGIRHPEDSGWTYDSPCVHIPDDDETVERMARAIADDDLTAGDTMLVAEQSVDEAWPDYVGNARAVIATMRGETR